METERRWRVSDLIRGQCPPAVIDPHFKQLNWLSDEEKEQEYKEMTTLSKHLAIYEQEETSTADEEEGEVASAAPKEAKV